MPIGSSGLWEHPDWARQKARQENNDDDEGTGLDYIDFDVLNNWVVKLRFDKFLGNKLETGVRGNGFFLNVPNITDKHVILTAAHNLISDNGIRTSNLKLIYNNPLEPDPDNPDKEKYADDKEQPIIQRDIDNTDSNPNIYICKGYKVGIPSGDYGVICIPPTSKGSRGFGFSLRLAYKKSFKGNVHVSGFLPTASLMSLRPVTSSSSKMIYHGDHIEYHAKTEQGISGSPVWVEYMGYPTVIAVHNNGFEKDPNKPQIGSRGALLTFDLLHDVFEWLDRPNTEPKLLRKGIQIQVLPKDLIGHPAAPHGLFLSFMSNTGFARVRLGSGTKFEWMLAQVGSKDVYYALVVVGESKWLRFNLDASTYQGVELSETMDRRGCLLVKLGTSAAWMNFGVETGKLRLGVKETTQLRMEGTYIKTYDVEHETSEVSWVVRASPDSKRQFNKFILKAA